MLMNLAYTNLSTMFYYLAFMCLFLVYCCFKFNLVNSKFIHLFFSCISFYGFYLIIFPDLSHFFPLYLRFISICFIFNQG